MTIDPESVARSFHEAYERLAPSFGYKTREASAVPWEDVPDGNRRLMIAVAGEVAPLIAAQALREAAGQGHPSSPAWSDRTCAACHRRVRVWEGSDQGQQHRVILDPEPTDEGDTVILADRPVGVIREDVVGRYTLYRSHFRNCPKHLIEDAP